MRSALDRERLTLLVSRLGALDLHLPSPHERGIHEVARQALTDEIHALGRRLDEGTYWRPSEVEAAARRCARSA